MIFESPTHGPMALTQVVDYLAAYIREAPDQQHKVIIGTDSSPAQAGLAQFITAIVVHRVGRGGIYFWTQSQQDKLHTLRDRMYHEAVCSLNLARQLVDPQLVMLGLDGAHTVEIHIDIGENGPTRQMIKEIVGMVAGSGFTVRTKPASFAASKVADRYT